MVRIYTVPAGTKGQTDELDTEWLGCQRKKALQRVLQGLQTLVGAAGFELATLCSQSSNAAVINQQLSSLLSNGGCLVARHAP